MIYVGTIDLAGSDFKTSKAGDPGATSTPFVVPAGFRRLVVQPSTATIMLSLLSVSLVADGGTNCTAAKMLQLGGANAIQEVICDKPNEVQVVARKTDAGAGTLKVFGVR